MNHELIMLRKAKRMRQLAKTLTEEARCKAIKSHSVQNIKGGTMGQIEEIFQLIQLRDDCLLFCKAVSDGLSVLDVDDRRLRVKYYFKRTEIGALADSLKVSQATVYRKLHGARTRFKEALASFGYNERWFQDVFGQMVFD